MAALGCAARPRRGRLRRPPTPPRRPSATPSSRPSRPMRREHRRDAHDPRPQLPAAGATRTPCVFKRDGAPAVFVKADVGTAKLLKVKLPAKLASALLERQRRRRRRPASACASSPSASASPSRSAGRSPRDRPELPPAAAEDRRQSSPTPTATATATSSNNRDDADDDNDLLADALEMSARHRPLQGRHRRRRRRGRLRVPLRPATSTTTSTRRPTSYLPYPGKRPYPNAARRRTPDVDYDGDTLTLAEEYGLWKSRSAPRRPARPRTRSTTPTASSTRSTPVTARRPPPPGARRRRLRQAGRLPRLGRPQRLPHGRAPAPGDNWFDARTRVRHPRLRPQRHGRDTPNGGANRPEITYYDRDRDGRLSDDERDEDADGLTNCRRDPRPRARRSYWKALLRKETPYYLAYAGTSSTTPTPTATACATAPTTRTTTTSRTSWSCSRSHGRGAGRRDPLNLATAAGGPPMAIENGFVNPFNPCLPSPTRARATSTRPSGPAGRRSTAARTSTYYVWN